MSIDLPAVITAYLAAANTRDLDAAASCFDEGAVVFDEGQERKGVAAIRAWSEETGNKYAPQTQATAVQLAQSAAVVTARVSGNFPGSPVELRYFFTLRNDKIAQLEIKS